VTHEFVIFESHRGLLFEDGRFVKVLSPGRYKVRPDDLWRRLLRKPVVSIREVDVRQRELTIKGQEILTSDKVAIRVSILVQYQVTDPRAAVLNVEQFVDRIYSDVQLAARRSLAGMTLEEILTNRTRLSEEILQDVQENAASYGVEIRRADVKDLIFPGNLQEVMNRVLRAERLSQAELIEARTAAEKARIAAEVDAAEQQQRARAEAESIRLRAEAEAEAKRIASRAEVEALEQRRALGPLYREHPVLLRMEELSALRELAKVANARIYVGFDKHAAVEE
jgi:regulator of protease activity HflC (stomatin/prohibitin superfamily)